MAQVTDKFPPLAAGASTVQRQVDVDTGAGAVAIVDHV